MQFNIRFGELLNVIGSPVRFEEVTFVPASIQLAGTDYSPQFDLLDWAEEASIDLPAVVHEEENAPWVLGRLIYLFNAANTSEEERGEKCCLNASFVAILHDQDNLSIPFEVMDYYGQTKLWFSTDDEPPLDVRTAIANAFYGMLLSEPDLLTDYENRMFHSGACVWINFGVSCGEPYWQEE